MRANANHLFGGALRNAFLQLAKREASYRERADLGYIDDAFARDNQGISFVHRAEELDDHRVVCTDHIIGGHRNVLGRRKGGRGRIEQTVAEGLKRLYTRLFHGQNPQLNSVVF